MNSRNAVVLVFLAASCGSTPDNSYRGKPLYTLHGTAMQTPSTPPIAHPRAAVAWFDAVPLPNAPLAPSCPDYAPTEVTGSSQLLRGPAVSEVVLSSQFPAAFTIDVFAPPPDEAFSSANDWAISYTDLTLLAEARVALGYVFVYDDRNGNSRFDPIPADASAPIDWILATSDGGVDSYQLVYLQVDPAQIPAGFPLRAGLNLVHDHYERILVELPPTEFLDPATPMTMTMDNSIDQAVGCAVQPPMRLCLNRVGRVDWSQLPVTHDQLQRITCDYELLWWRTPWTPVRASICAPAAYTAESGSSQIDPGAPVPSDWPCPLTPTGNPDGGLPDAT
jgi:hypothetical protein